VEDGKAAEGSRVWKPNSPLWPVLIGSRVAFLGPPNSVYGPTASLGSSLCHFRHEPVNWPKKFTVGFSSSVRDVRDALTRSSTCIQLVMFTFRHLVAMVDA
jgi:hypothetical protein